jgi:hypothetical protein
VNSRATWEGIWVVSEGTTWGSSCLLNRQGLIETPASQRRRVMGDEEKEGVGKKRLSHWNVFCFIYNLKSGMPCDRDPILIST